MMGTGGMVEFKNIVCVKILIFKIEGRGIDESPAVEEGVNAHEPVRILANEFCDIFS